MRNAACLILKHRFRVVQEFTPLQRRIKCERCGGDWGMHDGVQTIVDWTPDLQQFYADIGIEILEPIDPDPRYDPPLSFPELIRASRWQGALAMGLAFSAGYAVQAAGFGLVAQFIVSAAIGYVSMRFLMWRVLERRRNTLQA